MNLRRQGIIDIFTKLAEEKIDIWLSGKFREGECRIWYGDYGIGKSFGLSTWEKGKLHGEYKTWFSNGQIGEHSFYKNDRLHGEYKRWYDNGQIQKHAIYKDGKVVKKIV